MHQEKANRKMKNIRSNTSQAKISKGYRLKPSTHRLIKQVQRSLNITQDKIITMAIKLFRKETGNKVKTRINK